MLNVNQGCGAVSQRNWCPMIWDTVLPQIFWGANLRLSRHHLPEERRIQLHRYRDLKTW